MATNKNTHTRPQPHITVPPKKVRAVSLGIVIALAFTCTTVGFAIGKLSTPPAMPGVSGPGGNFPAPPDGFPGGGFPGAPTAP